MPVQRKLKRETRTAITVDDVELVWWIHTEPQWTSEHGYRGLTLAVQTAAKERRELRLEYPFPEKRPKRFPHLPEMPKLTDEFVARAIRQAMAGGWNPMSRGRVFVWEVE